MTQLLVCTAAIVSLFGVVGCNRSPSIEGSVTREQYRLLQAQARALTDTILLEELRSGRLTNAIELIEQDLDIQVITIGRFKVTATGPEAAEALSILGAVADYRSIYPRNAEARIEGVEHLDAVLTETQEHVQQILRDVRATGVQQSDAHEPPPRASVSRLRDFRMLDSQPAPVSGGGR